MTTTSHFTMTCPGCVKPQSKRHPVVTIRKFDSSIFGNPNAKVDRKKTQTISSNDLRTMCDQ